MRMLIALTFAGLALAACASGPSASVWACAGQSDLLVTTEDASISIFSVNSGETLTLAETEDGRMWEQGRVFWRITGLDQALYQTAEGRVLNCRRPG